MIRGDIIRNCIIAVTSVGMLFKLVEAVLYIRLAGQSDNIPASKNKLMKQMKLKFENCYKLDLGVQNVNAFVDKYVGKYRVCGISLHGFGRVPVIAAWLSGITGIGLGFYCYLAGYSVQLGAAYEVWGIGSVLLLKLVSVILDTEYKRSVLYSGLIDFFENSFANHLAQNAAGEAAFVTMEEEEAGQAAPAEEKQAGREDVKSRKKAAQSEEDQAIIEDVLSQFLS